MVVLVLAGVVYSSIGIERQPWLVLVAVAVACFVGGRTVARVGLLGGGRGVRGKQKWKAKVD